MLNKEKTGLLIVDVQGKLASIVHDSDALITSTVALARGAKALKLPIVWLEQQPLKLGKTVPALAEALKPLQAISKHTFSGVASQECLQAIQNSKVDSWLICGIETHICVYQTACDLMKMDLNVQVVADCVSSRKPFNKELALRSLEAKGASITSLEMCLYGLVGDSLAPEFREILGLIK